MSGDAFVFNLLSISSLSIFSLTVSYTIVAFNANITPNFANVVQLVVFLNHTTLTNFSTKYRVMCKFYTVVCGIKQLYHECTTVRKISSMYMQTNRGITFT